MSTSKYQTVDPQAPPEPKRVLKMVLLVGSIMAMAVILSLATVLTGRPDVAPLIRVATIPEDKKLSAETERRLIIVGDVHGQLHEFKKLLKEVRFDKEKDLVVLLGDFTTKGPDSLDLIDKAIDIGAMCVRGNHEDELVSLYAEAHHLDIPKTYPPHATATTITFGEQPTPTLDPTPGPKRDDDSKLPFPDYSHEAPNPNFEVEVADRHRDWPLAKKMKKHHMKYIQNCPSVLELGNVSKRGINGVACHGGLVWHQRDLEDQDPEVTLRIRGLLPPHYMQPSEGKDGEAWYKYWGDEQRRRPKNERYQVFYGHDASKGLQLHKYSRGLDSRCVKGGELSAYVITVDRKGHFHEKLHQVDCSAA